MNETIDWTARGWELLLKLAEDFLQWLATSGVQILLILALSWTAFFVLSRLLTRMHRVFAGPKATEERIKRADTLTGILRLVLGILVTVAAGMMMLQEVGVDITPLLATAGFGGLAIGFGAQSLVRDVITGFFLLAEDQIRIGDIAEVAGKAGVVEGISLRTVRLRDLSGHVHIVPSGSIDVVTNMTKDYGCYLMDVGVAYREDPDEVMEVLREIGEELQNDPTYGTDILGPLEIFGVNAFDDSAVVIRARLKTRPMRQWAIGREFNRRMKKAFDERDIEIPFPHVTLYAGRDKQGEAPSLPLEVSNPKAA